MASGSATSDDPGEGPLVVVGHQPPRQHMDLTGVTLVVDAVKAHGGMQPLVELLRKPRCSSAFVRLMPRRPLPDLMVRCPSRGSIAQPDPGPTLSPRSVDETVTAIDSPDLM